MVRANAPKKDELLRAAQIVFRTLEPLAEDLRNRVLTSALSLLGMPKLPELNESQVAPQPRPPSHGPQQVTRQLAPTELLQDKRPSTNAQRIAIFAYYRDKFEGKPRFARADLKDYFANARLPPPRNFDRDFKHAIQLGYVYEDGQESYLTSRGLEAVETGFDGKAEPRGSTAKSAKKTRPRRSTSKPAKKERPRR